MPWLAPAALVLDLATDSQIILEAQVFVIARPIYVLVHAMVVPFVRSIIAVGGWVGLVQMALGLTGGAA